MPRRAANQRISLCGDPRALRESEQHRKLRVVPGEDSDDAVIRASKFSWWPAVVRVQPTHAGKFWLWTVNTKRLVKECPDASQERSRRR